MSHHIRISKRVDLDMSWMMEDKSMNLLGLLGSFSNEDGKGKENVT